MNTEILPLSKYPAAIAAAEMAILEQSKSCREIAVAVEARKAEIESLIASDETLTNDTKRKAKRQELMIEPETIRLTEFLQESQDKLTELRIELTFLVNCFAVSKLELQDAIASAHA